jgi:glycosyltransferase involved in cell wall biosynthesis
MPNTAPITAAPAPLAAESPADLPWQWDVTRLVEQADVHGQELGLDGVAALYGLWLSRNPGPESAVARFNLCVALHAGGRWEAAEREYRELLRRLDLPQARYNLGLLLERAGRSEEATTQWSKVARSDADPALRLQALAAQAGIARKNGCKEDLREALVASLELQPGQPGLTEELRALDLSGPPADAVEQPAPKICVIAVCFNEAPILPFFLDHYIHYVGASKVVLHDGGSTDGSAAIAARYPQVEFLVSPSEKLDDRELMQIRNEGWKPYRQAFDWIVVCDVDEFLYHPELHRTLRDFKRNGVTLPMVQGFNIISRAHPAHRAGRFLWQDCQSGWPDPQYLDKNLIFDPSIDINYLLGCHNCQPTGPVKRSAERTLKNLHMCMPSYAHMIAKSRRSAARLSDWNRQTNAGFHYRLQAELTRAQYNAKFLAASNVLSPQDRPQLQREGFEWLQRWLAQRDEDPRVLEVGLPGGNGASSDTGSHGFFAWVVHSVGGRLLTADADARRLRHAHRQLSASGLQSERVASVELTNLAGEAAAQGPFDLVYFNRGDHYGDETDLAEGQRQALMQFLDVQDHLRPGGLVAFDDAAARGQGRCTWVAELLAGRGWTCEQVVDTRIYRRPSTA